MQKNTLEKNINTGVRLDPLKMGAFIAGLESGIVYKENNPSGDYTDYLPTDEFQSSLIIDTLACVTFSGTNVAEILFNMMIAQKKVSKENLDWLTKNGYFDENGKINFSDRFSAKTNGTSKSGNSMDNFWLGVKNFGLIPEKMWAWNHASSFTWDQYYAQPTPECFALGEEFKKRFEVLWEVVTYFSNTPNPKQKDLLSYHLKQSPLHVATIVGANWNRIDGKPVESNQCGWGHATTIYKINKDGTYGDFDHYDPCRKLLSADYCINIVYKGVFSEKVSTPAPVPENALTHEFKTIMKYKQSSDEIKLYQQALKALGFFKAIPTGYYGDVTRASTKKFQAFYKVASASELATVDGKQAGLKTLARLNLLLAGLRKNPTQERVSIDDAGLDLIKSFEGCILKPYQDVTGTWTIGWGNTYIDGKPVTASTPKLTQAQADALLLKSIKENYEPTVYKQITRKLTQNEHNACVSFCYNLGSMRGLADKINAETVTVEDWLAYSYAKVGQASMASVDEDRSNLYRGDTIGSLEDFQGAEEMLSSGIMKQLPALLARRKKEADLYFKK